MQEIILAAGCFWGVQYYLDQIPGVVRTIAGYTGGATENPTYEEVCSHMTGHAEAVLVEFDEQRLPLDILLRHFFRLHDSTQLNRQGPDIGDNYRSAIFCVTDEQRQVAERLITELRPAAGAPIVTTVEPAGPFYEAEAYHQKYTERTGRGQCHVAYLPL